MNGNEPELSYRVSYTQALTDLKGELTKLTAAQGEMKEDLRRALSENTELKARVRSLELRFYGLLAGLVTSIVVLYSQGGIQLP